MSGFDVRNSLFVDGALAGGDNRLRGYGPPPDVVGRAVHFDTSTAVYKATALTGAAASATGTLSVWFKAADTSEISFIWVSPDLNGSGYPNYTDQVMNLTRESGSTGILQGIFRAQSGGSLPDSTTVRQTTDNTGITAWHHVMMAWNTNFAAGSRVAQMAVDGTLIATNFPGGFDNGGAFTVLTTAPGWSINSGGFNGSTVQSAIAVDMTEFYLNTDEYINLAYPANIAKFRNPSTSKPKYLGADGSEPTGTAPKIYLTVVEGAAVTTFATNKGTGGNFSIAGALTFAATDPY